MKPLLLPALVLGACLAPIASVASPTSEKFQSQLEEACLKIDSPAACQCYARRVTSRYNDQQLLAIFKLLKNKEASQMFMVTHAVEGRACKSPD